MLRMNCIDFMAGYWSSLPLTTKLLQVPPIVPIWQLYILAFVEHHILWNIILKWIWFRWWSCCSYDNWLFDLIWFDLIYFFTQGTVFSAEYWSPREPLYTNKNAECGKDWPLASRVSYQDHSVEITWSSLQCINLIPTSTRSQTESVRSQMSHAIIRKRRCNLTWKNSLSPIFKVIWFPVKCFCYEYDLSIHILSEVTLGISQLSTHAKWPISDLHLMCINIYYSGHRIYTVKDNVWTKAGWTDRWCHWPHPFGQNETKCWVNPYRKKSLLEERNIVCAPFDCWQENETFLDFVRYIVLKFSNLCHY